MKIYSITNLVVLILYHKYYYFYRNLVKIKTIWLLEKQEIFSFRTEVVRVRTKKKLSFDLIKGPSVSWHSLTRVRRKTRRRRASARGVVRDCSSFSCSNRPVWSCALTDVPHTCRSSAGSNPWHAYSTGRTASHHCSAPAVRALAAVHAFPTTTRGVVSLSRRRQACTASPGPRGRPGKKSDASRARAPLARRAPAAGGVTGLAAFSSSLAAPCSACAPRPSRPAMWLGALQPYVWPLSSGETRLLLLECWFKLSLYRTVFFFFFCFSTAVYVRTERAREDERRSNRERAALCHCHRTSSPAHGMQACFP
jgi:hypothetical protein